MAVKMVMSWKVIALKIRIPELGGERRMPLPAECEKERA